MSDTVIIICLCISLALWALTSAMIWYCLQKIDKTEYAIARMDERLFLTEHHLSKIEKGFQQFADVSLEQVEEDVRKASTEWKNRGVDK